MTQAAPAGPAGPVYGERLAARRDALASLEQQHLRLSRLRVLFIALAVVVGTFGGRAWGNWAAVPAGAFVVAAILHARRLDERRRTASAVTFYERGLERLEHRWIGRGELGSQFLDPEHPSADDLDLFGRGSLFELLATTRTRAGQATLARWLLHPADPDEVRARQAAVRELAPRIDLRESIAVIGDGMNVGVDADGLRAWSTAPIRLSGTLLRLAIAALPVALVMQVVWIATSGLTLGGLRLLVATVLAQGAVAMWLRPRVSRVIHEFHEPTRDLELLSGLLLKLEQEKFDSPKLQGLQASLAGSTPASLEIRRLSQLLALVLSRRNLFFALVAAHLMWATQWSFAVEAWRRRAGRHVPVWLDAVGEFEALVALATFAYENPGYSFPMVDPEAEGLRACALAHPLLGDGAVPNDVTLGGDGPSIFIVSGSNMSGKSTWLRAIGVNAALAQAGAPVRAAELRMPPLEVGASMRSADSLVDGRSRFFDEITRLKQIVDLARERQGRVLFLFDEVLAGTNSHDRRLGAEGLLAGITALGAIGLVTTHDLALGELAGRLAVRAENVHFEDTFDGERLVFDYRLKPGIVRTSNAIALMRTIGLDV